MRATGLDVAVESEGQPFALSAAVELTLYRIVQEALTNTLKHAAATKVTVTLRYHEPAVELEVADDGTQASVDHSVARRSSGGHGIEGMRERANLHGGDGAGGSRRLRWLDRLSDGPRGRSGLFMIRVALVDDQELLRLGFRMILDTTEDITVVGEAGNGKRAVELVSTSHPDVVLMDIRMPVMDGIEATRQIVALDPAVRVLVLTTFDLDEYAFGALRAGASGFLLKDVPPGQLTGAIRTVASGDAVVSPRITRRLLDEYAHLLATRGDDEPMDRALSSLTAREREVLIALAEGLSNAEIAARLFVSEATVKSHVGKLLAKIGLRDRLQAVVFAFETGLVRPREERPLFVISS